MFVGMALALGLFVETTLVMLLPVLLLGFLSLSFPFRRFWRVRVLRFAHCMSLFSSRRLAATFRVGPGTRGIEAIR